MICPSCQTNNPPDARFCMSCGTSLAVTCPACGTELPPGAQFCFKCGHRLAEPTPELPRPIGESPDIVGPVEARIQQYIPRELLSKLEFARSSGGMQGERRVVTMLFCDVQGSTAAAERLDPEEWAEIMNGAFEYLIAPVYQYEGTLARLMGEMPSWPSLAPLLPTKTTPNEPFWLGWTSSSVLGPTGSRSNKNGAWTSMCGWALTPAW